MEGLWEGKLAKSPGMRISDGASVDLEKAHFTQKGGVWLHGRREASDVFKEIQQSGCAGKDLCSDRQHIGKLGT